MAIILDKNTNIVIQGITGREASMVTRHTLNYGTPILAGVTPGKGGQRVESVSVYNSLELAISKNPAINTTAIYVPPAFVYDAVLEAIFNNIKIIFIATENVPQRDAIKFLKLAKEKGVYIIGPNSVGIISPKYRMKIGAIGGDNVERCFVPGSVGVISRSGGMTAETAFMIKRAGFGVSSAVSIGGDPFIGMKPLDLIKLFGSDDETEAIVMFSEPGTNFEEEVADYLKHNKYNKPIIAFIAGRFTESLPEDTVFGHAGAMISKGIGKPSEKIKKLKDCGVYVADKFDDIQPLLRDALG
ncbi:MAG: succinate--CoA ligase subunit alpha [Deferribacterota bacterium]|nr:succinate--CoA ligase subunit alpha [Deferribacterota bacterium]